jgi:hypothetical protein
MLLRREFGAFFVIRAVFCGSSHGTGNYGNPVPVKTGGIFIQVRS